MLKEKYIAFMGKKPKPSKVEEGAFFISQMKNGVKRKEIIGMILELRKIKKDSAKLYVTRAIDEARNAGHEFNGKPIKGDKKMEEKKQNKTITVESGTTTENVNPEVVDTPNESTLNVEELAEKIRYYTEQVRDNIINIGHCLIEAKKLVKHGEWDKWIEANTTFTRQTVHKFMQCAKRFADVAPAKHLNQTQMMELLALPEPQTEAFLKAKEDEGKSIKDMTKATLRSEIKSWNEAHPDIKKSASGNKRKNISANEQDVHEESEAIGEQQAFKIVELKVRIGEEEELVQILKDALEVAENISDENKVTLQEVIDALSVIVDSRIRYQYNKKNALE